MSKGFAFIQYTCQDDALLALETMDRQVLNLDQNRYTLFSIEEFDRGTDHYFRFVFLVQELDGRTIYVELSKLRKDSFRGSPRTCGPPNATISGS